MDEYKQMGYQRAIELRAYHERKAAQLERYLSERPDLAENLLRSGLRLIAESRAILEECEAVIAEFESRCVCGEQLGADECAEVVRGGEHVVVHVACLIPGEVFA